MTAMLALIEHHCNKMGGEEHSERRSSANLNSVFYAEAYHPIQAGSIDGTDILPHDNAIYRALLCSNAGLYDPFGDPKAIGDPYSTLFVGRLSHLTTEQTLLQEMSKYGRVKSLRIVRHIVTGASRGYAFVEFETDRDMRRAYKDAHHKYIDDSEIIVDYNRQRLMPGWIPRRLGGGLGGKKESGQLRFGGRERPFRAPLRQIPLDDLKKLGIPPPPEGRYMSRFQAPSPPRRERSSGDNRETLLTSMIKDEVSILIDRRGLQVENTYLEDVKGRWTRKIPLTGRETMEGNGVIQGPLVMIIHLVYLLDQETVILVVTPIGKEDNPDSFKRTCASWKRYEYDKGNPRCMHKAHYFNLFLPLVKLIQLPCTRIASSSLAFSCLSSYID